MRLASYQPPGFGMFFASAVSSVGAAAPRSIFVSMPCLWTRTNTDDMAGNRAPSDVICGRCSRTAPQAFAIRAPVGSTVRRLTPPGQGRGSFQCPAAAHSRSPCGSRQRIRRSEQICARVAFRFARPKDHEFAASSGMISPSPGTRGVMLHTAAFEPAATPASRLSRTASQARRRLARKCPRVRAPCGLPRICFDSDPSLAWLGAPRQRISRAVGCKGACRRRQRMGGRSTAPAADGTKTNYARCAKRLDSCIVARAFGPAGHRGRLSRRVPDRVIPDDPRKAAPTR